VAMSCLDRTVFSALAFLAAMTVPFETRSRL